MRVIDCVLTLFLNYEGCVVCDLCRSVLHCVCCVVVRLDGIDGTDRGCFKWIV